MKLPSSFYNPASLLGSILASISLLIIIFFLVGTSLFDIGGSYVGLIIFIILPVFLIIGLILIPFGMLRRSRKIKREGDAAIKKGIKLDLNDKRQDRKSVV